MSIHEYMNTYNGLPCAVLTGWVISETVNLFNCTLPCAWHISVHLYTALFGNGCLRLLTGEQP